MNKQILIVVPVKECSQRVPGKNLRPLLGKPLFLYALNAARQAAHFLKPITSRICVVTESWKVVEYAWGCVEDVHYIVYDDPALARDPYQTADACLYALDHLECQYKDIIMVQPSNPFVIAWDIVQSYQIYLGYRGVYPVRTVCPIEKQVWFKGEEDHRIYPLVAKGLIGTGSVIVCSVDYLKERRGFVGVTIPCYIEPERAIDIDTEADFAAAEKAMTAILGKGDCLNESDQTCTGTISGEEGRNQEWRKSYW